MQLFRVSNRSRTGLLTIGTYRAHLKWNGGRRPREYRMTREEGEAMVAEYIRKHLSGEPFLWNDAIQTLEELS